ncbi:DUF2244 domain-containing protein [Kordiimonas sp. SCSIO 12610]|uniref:DUF2244 domain-containing protein n=1 Tax=Kordiimonas sp. SCSIO 12610 TaxID=2829597 RepID=UPI00210DD2F2|nr:DUF2244 domain-containing protein [Kordiimonas sp. SCSIO 12610]UTW55458.1 DUF2244 domain-containing protein [Kordiimonas sp. SCSIO 12610]
MSNAPDDILQPDSIRYSRDEDLPALEGSDTFLSVKLFPHRSMTPKNVQTMLIIIGIICALAGIRFIIAGAWPVVLFVLFDVIALGFAFYFNFRAARLYETVHLTQQSLIICRIHPNRQVETWSLEPYWLQVRVKETSDNDKLQILSHGKQLEIGEFLTAYEKRDFANSLDKALNDWKRQDFVT